MKKKAKQFAHDNQKWNTEKKNPIDYCRTNPYIMKIAAQKWVSQRRIPWNEIACSERSSET